MELYNLYDYELFANLCAIPSPSLDAAEQHHDHDHKNIMITSTHYY